MTMYEKVRELCEKQGFEISHLGKVIPEVNLPASTISGWKTGAKPRVATIKAIADYFDVPFEYLANDSGAPTPAATNGVIAPSGRELSEQEKVLLDIYSELDVVGQARLLAFASDLRGEV